MYEYIKEKKTDPSKQGFVKKDISLFQPHDFILQRIISDSDSYADRNVKLGYCPVRGTESIVQLKKCLNCGKSYIGCKCGEDFKEDDSDDSTYCENQHEQYLSAPRLRSSLGANGMGGEAHHIFPGNVVLDLGLDNSGKYRDSFNEAWNGIMLDGSFFNGGIIHKYNGSAPTIKHRRNNQPQHNVYDKKVCEYIKRNYIESKIKNYDDLMKLADNIKSDIINSDKNCLDDL